MSKKSHVSEHVGVAVTGKFPSMTYALAMAAGRDAANRSMRAAGRAAWSMDDLNVASETFNRLYGERSA